MMDWGAHAARVHRSGRWPNGYQSFANLLLAILTTSVCAAARPRADEARTQSTTSAIYGFSTNICFADLAASISALTF